jgi:hypothetical protein
MNQLSLPLEAPPRPIEIADPRVDPRAVPRLGRQHAAILERLRRGPATNHQLSQIGLRFGGRIHELRRAGHNIETFDRDHETGVVWYRLNDEPARQP